MNVVGVLITNASLHFLLANRNCDVVVRSRFVVSVKEENGFAEPAGREKKIALPKSDAVKPSTLEFI